MQIMLHGNVKKKKKLQLLHGLQVCQGLQWVQQVRGIQQVPLSQQVRALHGLPKDCGSERTLVYGFVLHIKMLRDGCQGVTLNPAAPGRPGGPSLPGLPCRDQRVLKFAQKKIILSFRQHSLHCR